MASWEYELATAPTSEADRKQWLQNAAAFVLLQDIRSYAREQIDVDLSPEASAAAEKSIDDAIYGLMMILDGVSGYLCTATQAVEVRASVRLKALSAAAPDEVVAELDLAEGDGMCMGYHRWLKGDFGPHPVVMGAIDDLSGDATEDLSSDAAVPEDATDIGADVGG